MLFFRPFSVLASRLPSLLWGIDTAAVYDTVKTYKVPVAPVRVPWTFQPPQAKAKLLG